MRRNPAELPGLAAKPQSPVSPSARARRRGPRSFRRSVWLPAVVLEIEAEERADDGAQLLALVVEGEEISRLGILAYEQKVQDADRLVALELSSSSMILPSNSGVRVEADRQQAGPVLSSASSFTSICCRRSASSRLFVGVDPTCFLSAFTVPRDLVSLGVAGPPVADVEQQGEDHPEPIEPVNPTPGVYTIT